MDDEVISRVKPPLSPPLIKGGDRKKPPPFTKGRDGVGLVCRREWTTGTTGRNTRYILKGGKPDINPTRVINDNE